VLHCSAVVDLFPNGRESQHGRFSEGTSFPTTAKGGENVGGKKGEGGGARGEEKEGHLNSILPRRRHNLPTVELKSGDGVVVTNCVGDGAGAEIPDLDGVG
jgi:hypothetical protein